MAENGRTGYPAPVMTSSGPTATTTSYGCSAAGTAPISPGLQSWRSASIVALRPGLGAALRAREGDQLVTFHQRYYPDVESPYDTILVELDEGQLFISDPDGFTNNDLRLRLR